jgi:DNA-binding response OmpR family regulator
MTPSTAHILLVDDEEVDRGVISHILESSGFTVASVGDYREALDVFNKQSELFDLLISDISLPTGNGVDLAKALLRKKPSLKILLISGWVGAEIMQHHGIPSADRHFLPKPFTAGVLLNRVRQILETDEVWEWLQRSGKDAHREHSNGG